MKHWSIIKYVIRSLSSWDLRAHADDVYDDEGNIVLLGPWLDKAHIWAHIATGLMFVLNAPIHFLLPDDMLILKIVMVVLNISITPYTLPSLYVLHKRAVFLKQK